MDAHALLSAQGWRGHGHSLHKTDDSIGLAKPLLLNRKNNTKGLGDKQHFTSDQWWMNAFDEQLKGLETTKKGVKQTITTGKLNAIENGSLGKYSLYTSFVRGGLLEGTLEHLAKQAESDSTTDEDEEEKDTSTKKETKEERKARKEAKRQRKEARALKRAAKEEKRALKAKAKESDSSSSSSSRGSKAEEKRLRRARKEEKRRKRAEKAA